jgi:hypothetical protein
VTSQPPQKKWAEIVRLYAEVRDLGGRANKITAELLRAEYQLGLLLTPYKEIGRPKKGSPRDLSTIGTKSDRYVWRILAQLPEADFERELQRIADSGKQIVRNHFERLAGQHAARQANASTRQRRPSSLCRVEVADIRDGLPFIQDHTVDLILCDPFYDLRSLPVYRSLGMEAQRTLRTGGLCAAMVGHTNLRRKHDVLAEFLEETWEIAYMLPRPLDLPSSPRMKILTGRRDRAQHKPVFVYSNGRRTRDIRGSVVHAEHVSDTLWHPRGQDEAGFTQLVELLSDRGDLVCDPFIGGGTTAIACMKTGRRFVGSDINTEHVEMTLRRLGSDDK